MGDGNHQQLVTASQSMAEAAAAADDGEEEVDSDPNTHPEGDEDDDDDDDNRNDVNNNTGGGVGGGGSSSSSSTTINRRNDAGNKLEARWEGMFQRLCKYKEQNGNVLVPNRYEVDPALGSWVSTQRRQYKLYMSKGGGQGRFGGDSNAQMDPTRIRKLESIGMVWQTKDPRQVPWETRFEELKEYRRIHGHCIVPIAYEKNLKLANWVSTQRQEGKLFHEGRSSRLTNEKVKQLDSIGFVWKAPRGVSSAEKRLRLQKTVDNRETGDKSGLEAQRPLPLESTAPASVAVSSNGSDIADAQDTSTLPSMSELSASMATPTPKSKKRKTFQPKLPASAPCPPLPQEVVPPSSSSSVASSAASSAQLSMLSRSLRSNGSGELSTISGQSAGSYLLDRPTASGLLAARSILGRGIGSSNHSLAMSHNSDESSNLTNYLIEAQHRRSVGALSSALSVSSNPSRNLPDLAGASRLASSLEGLMGGGMIGASDAPSASSLGAASAANLLGGATIGDLNAAVAASPLSTRPDDPTLRLSSSQSAAPPPAAAAAATTSAASRSTLLEQLVRTQNELAAAQTTASLLAAAAGSAPAPAPSAAVAAALSGGSTASASSTSIDFPSSLNALETLTARNTLLGGGVFGGGSESRSFEQLVASAATPGASLAEILAASSATTSAPSLAAAPAPSPSSLSSLFAATATPSIGSSAAAVAAAASAQDAALR